LGKTKTKTEEKKKSFLINFLYYSLGFRLGIGNRSIIADMEMISIEENWLLF